MSLPIAIAGAAGRMGQALVRAAGADARLRVAGATERAGSDALGKDAGVLAGLEPIGVAVREDVRAAASEAAVWVDFTTPGATAAALAALRQSKLRAAIIGTTGLDASCDAALAEATARMAVVRSGNFSLGVNLLVALTRQAAARLGPEWDIEIFEAHHRRKVDAPSGTAQMLGEAAAAGRGVALADVRVAARDGQTGPRPPGAIGFAVSRAGGIVGEHEVTFGAERELVRLSHVALDRAVFADGALAAALWAAERAPGLYSMQDVLGF